MNVSARQKGAWGLANTVVVIAAILPVVWIISLSLKDPATIADGRFLPSKWSFDNYSGIFRTSEFTRALINSIGIAAISTVLACALAAMAAYAIARLDFPGKVVILTSALAIAMFPPIAIVGPIFNIWKNVGLFDTWPGLIIPYMTFTLPLAIYTMSAFPGESQFTQPTGSIAAAAVVVTIPIIIMVFIFQRRIVAGLTAGAVKG